MHALRSSEVLEKSFVEKCCKEVLEKSCVENVREECCTVARYVFPMKHLGFIVHVNEVG